MAEWRVTCSSIHHHKWGLIFPSFTQPSPMGRPDRTPHPTDATTDSSSPSTSLDDPCDQCRTRRPGPMCGPDGRNHMSHCMAVQCAGIPSTDLQAGPCQSQVCLTQYTPSFQVCFTHPGYTSLSFPTQTKPLACYEVLLFSRMHAKITHVLARWCASIEKGLQPAWDIMGVLLATSEHVVRSLLMTFLQLCG